MLQLERRITQPTCHWRWRMFENAWPWLLILLALMMVLVGPGQLGTLGVVVRHAFRRLRR